MSDDIEYPREITPPKDTKIKADRVRIEARKIDKPTKIAGSSTHNKMRTVAKTSVRMKIEKAAIPVDKKKVAGNSE